MTRFQDPTIDGFRSLTSAVSVRGLEGVRMLPLGSFGTHVHVRVDNVRTLLASLEEKVRTLYAERHLHHTISLMIQIHVSPKPFLLKKFLLRYRNPPHS